MYPYVRAQNCAFNERPNRDVVQVGRDAVTGALKGRGSRAYTDFGPRRQRKCSARRWYAARRTSLSSRSGADFHPRERAAVESDKLRVECVGEPKIVRVVERQPRLLRQRDRFGEVDRLSEIENASRQGKSFEQRLSFRGGGANFLQAARSRLRTLMRPGAHRVAPRSRRAISSRLNSLKSNATMADASTTLSFTVFADEPRRFVSPGQTETAHSRDDFVHGERPLRPGRFVDQRP